MEDRGAPGRYREIYGDIGRYREQLDAARHLQVSARVRVGVRVGVRGRVRVRVC